MSVKSGRRAVAIMVVGASVLFLPGCNLHVKSVRAYGECSGKSGAGGECKAGAEVIWEGGGKRNFLAQLVNALPDAASFQLDTSGSTIPYPSSGSVTLQVKNSASGAIVAAQQFQWVKTGTVIKLANADSANNWLYANMGEGDALSYDLVPFRSRYGAGPQVIAGQAKYEGATQASYTVQFSGGSCSIHNTNQPCPIQ